MKKLSLSSSRSNVSHMSKDLYCDEAGLQINELLRIKQHLLKKKLLQTNDSTKYIIF